MTPRTLLLSALLTVTACAADPIDRFGPPATHRATAPVCGNGAGSGSGAPRPPPSPPAGAVRCTAEGRCADPLDRCVDFSQAGVTPSGGALYCVHDACQSDATCGAGRLCACPGEGAELVRVCIAANCRLDSDCATGFCSPSRGAGCGDYTVGWHCHTTDDECHNDSDCPGSGGGSGHCYYAADRTRWVCSPTHCG